MAGKKNECALHGTGSKTVNKTLIALIVLSFLLMTWHVWKYGQSEHSYENPAEHILEIQASGAEHSFIGELGEEMWSLFFSNQSVLSELWNVLPYFLIGVFLAGFIRTFKLAIKLRKTLVKHGFVSIFIASLAGILTPLCACGVLTTVISLLYAGLPLAPAMALLISSPLISPSTYLLTLNDLGPEWTAIRVIAAFLMGIFAGVVTHLVRNKGFQTDNLFLDGAIIKGDFHDEDYPDERLKCDCKQKFGNRMAAKTNNTFIIFLAKSYDMLSVVGKYVLVGVTMGAVIGRYIPNEWIYHLFGRNDQLNVVWISLGTIPMFLHQISASSILYHIKTSLNGTLDGGAGLAFLIGGPVTAIPAMTILWALFKKRVFALFMFISVAGTILLSYFFNYFVIAPDVDIGHPLLTGISTISGGESSVIIKKNKKVRIVMDPGGQNMVATYDDPIEGTGGIVFDAGFERFINVSAEDNEKYIQNVAEWLEETRMSIADRSILVYNTYQHSGFDTNSFNAVSSVLEDQNGFEVTVTERKETPELTDKLLRGYGQLWIIAGEARGQIFSDAEIEAVNDFVKDGNSLLIVAGPSDKNGEAPINQIASNFGVIYSGKVENDMELQVSFGSNIFSRFSTMLAKFYRILT